MKALLASGVVILTMGASATFASQTDTPAMSIAGIMVTPHVMADSMRYSHDPEHMNDESWFDAHVIEPHAGVAGLLHDPIASRIERCRAAVDFAAAEVNEDEHVGC